MERKEKIELVNKHIDQLIEFDAGGISEGRWQKNERPWQDLIYGDTKIDIEDRNQVERLTDNELDKIIWTFGLD